MKEFRKMLEQNIGKRNGYIEALAEQKSRLVKVKKELRNTEEGIPIAQLVAQQTQEELEVQISDVVSLALEAVFDDPYEFQLSFVSKRGQTEADMKFIKDGYERNPLLESGYGAVDVAALALRVALWNLSPKKSINTIILDEPGRFVSIDLQPKFGKMIKLLSDKLKIQFIIVTHSTVLGEYADKTFKVSQRKKISKVVEV